MGTSITLVSDQLSEIRGFSWTCKRKYQLSKGICLEPVRGVINVRNLSDTHWRTNWVDDFRATKLSD